MKKIYFALLVLLSVSVFSQKDYSRYYNSWRLGLNAGAAWQTADMRSCWGGAGGFTLEKGLGENATNFFSFAIRGRYLAANTYGMDYVRNYNFKDNDAYNGTYNVNIDYTDTAKYKLGYVFDNYKVKLGEGSLELQLTFNRLRQRTGLIFNLWGGVGVTSFRTKMDLIDGGGKLYNFSKVDSTGNESKAITNYNALIDKNYESYAYGSRNNDVITFSPSGGVGLGYQFTPGFSMLFEYKVTLPQGTSADLLDGKLSSNVDGIGGSNDYYHYAGVNLMFTLRGKKKNRNTNTVYTNTTVTTNSIVTTETTVPTNSLITNPVTEPKPIITYINPSVSGQVTNVAQYKIKAQILNVTSANQIKFKLNYTQYVNFTFDAQSHILEMNATLQPGNNLVQIVATNSAGSDNESTTIIYELPKPTGNPPVITITNPTVCPYNTQVNQYNFTANLSNVTAKSVLNVKVNNVPTNNYIFNRATNQLSLPLSLISGANNISISVSNEFGSDAESCTINYSSPIQQNLPPPVITFINPPSAGQTTTLSTYNVKAQVLNIVDQSGASVYVNGMSVPFSYNPNTKQLSLTASLLNGSNSVTIYANNTVGDDTKSTTIIYNQPSANTGVPPQVNLMMPSTANSSTFFTSYNFKLSVLNVASQADINVVFNGTMVTGFTYNLTTKILSFNTPLVTGLNTLVVKGTNQYGSDSKTINVTCKSASALKTPPTVTITTPYTNTTSVTNSAYTFKSTVNNVPNASGLVVKFNGTQVSTFTYDGFNLSFPATLNSGYNTFEVTGTNSDGSDSKTTQVLYRPTSNMIQPPVVSLVTPSSQQNTASNSVYMTKFQVFNVSSKNDITLLFNGVPQTNFTYNLNSKVVDFTANLNTGLNTIVVTGTNSAGSDFKQISINYQEVETVKLPPTVKITKPFISPASTQSPNYTFKATITNVPNSSGLVVKYNGNVVTSYAYDGFNLSFPTMLSQGNNNFEVKATNNDGSDTKSGVVRYTPKVISVIEDTTSVTTPTVISTPTIATTPVELDNKITICHIPPGNNQNPQTITISMSAWPAHQAHGDYMGSCQVNTTTAIPTNTTAPQEEKITICHIPPGNNQNPQTITIPMSAWSAHQAHGDYMGSCQVNTTTAIPTNTTAPQEEKITICHIPPGNNQNPQTITIPMSAWSAHQAHGDYMGSCQANVTPTNTTTPVEEDKKITICHVPPGNNQNPQTITISQSAWPAHQAHGDYLGRCSSVTPTVSTTPTSTQTPSTNEEKKITICHFPPGNNQNPQTITISQSAWTAHQAHGDIMGACPANRLSNPIKIDPKPGVINQNLEKGAKVIDTVKTIITTPTTTPRRPR